MYPNLKAEMARRNITIEGLGNILGITPPAASKKCSGKTDFTLKEAVTIKEALGVDIPLDVLFEHAEE